MTEDGCSVAGLGSFSKNMRGKMFPVNALLVVNAILMGVMVGIGAYGHRYRHHPLTRFLFLGATALFLPIISYVLSAIGNLYIITSFFEDETVTGRCDPSVHIDLVLIWIGLVQMVGISTTAIVAGDAREGRNISPPVVLLVQAMWTSYLAVYYVGNLGELARYTSRAEYEFTLAGLLVLALFALLFAKLYFKCYAWYKARQSLAIGCNPRLIVGYMEQLQNGSQHPEPASEHTPPPPLIVTGEDTISVDKEPHGYSIKWRSSNNGLLTIDKVWQLDDMHLRLTPQLKDVCFSFALSKLLRCRYARYTDAEAGFTKAYNFLRHMLLEDIDDDRVLRLIEYELSFLHDCYYSSLPISYSESWLPILSILVSLSSIGYCLATTIVICYEFVASLDIYYSPQISCRIQCSYPGNRTIISNYGGHIDQAYGNIYFNLVPVGLLLALVVLAETREIASYICSNWTKVALICRYINHASWQQSPSMQKCVGRVLQFRCKLLRHWEDKMNQCSILVLHPRRTPVALLRSLIPLPDRNKKVPKAVKTVVVDALKSYEGSRSGGVTSLRRNLQLKVGDNLLWTFNGAKGIAETMLVCHIATSIFEVRSQPHQPLSDYKIAATHLSRYCVYLVAYYPELLPDDEEWTKSLYKAIKKDAERILPRGIGVATPEEECRQLVRLLSSRSKHEVLKNGATLGGRLVELIEGEEMAWKVLSDFWSEMILYVAPSDNINGHAEAIARGGELITLLWALLAHLGAVRRPHDSAAATTAGAPVDV